MYSVCNVRNSADNNAIIFATYSECLIFCFCECIFISYYNYYEHFYVNIISG